jgi:tetratricopeptide (TPR) repeat protein
MNGGVWLKIGCVSLVLVTAGCGRIAQSVYLNGCDRDIGSATHAIDTAHDAAQRAKGFSQRGHAYSEKARYSRLYKLIPHDEYERLFNLAISDHGEAVALDPQTAEVYLDRGQAYYDRAIMESLEGKDSKPWFDGAASNFETAIQRDARNYLAFDRLGLVHEQNGEPEKAIEDYTKEMALNPLGKARLTDAYCTLGSHYHGLKKYDTAAAGYRKSIELRSGPDDGCACDPYESLMALYTVETRQYDQAWELVHLAQRSNRRLSPELIDRLKKDSGRRD